MAQARPRRRRIDVDGAWKRVLGDLLEEFVAFALPDLHAAVDWLRQPVFLEQELRPLLRRAAAGRRVADVVVQLSLRNGWTTWLLAHVEVQSRVEVDFAERMYNYAALLHQRFRRGMARQQGQDTAPPPTGIVGVAVLADSTPSWRPGEYHWGWGDYGVRYHYRVLKLTDWRSRAAESDGDPRLFAWVVRTWLAVQQAGRSLEAQATVRRSIGRELVAARRQGLLTPPQALGIYTFLDGVGGLPDTLAETIDQEVEFAEDTPMQEVLNRYERRAMERGLEQGRAEGAIEGMVTAALTLLSNRGLTLDAATESRIRDLDHDTLVAMIDALLRFESLADLDSWLSQHGG